MTAVSTQSQRSLNAFAVSLSAFAVVSPTSKNFSTGSKFFPFAAQYPGSRTVVTVGSKRIRHQIDGDCAANRRKLRCDSGEKRKLNTANHFKYNGNDVVDCFVINFILQNNEW